MGNTYETESKLTGKIRFRTGWNKKVILQVEFNGMVNRGTPVHIDFEYRNQWRDAEVSDLLELDFESLTGAITSRRLTAKEINAMSKLTCRGCGQEISGPHNCQGPFGIKEKHDPSKLIDLLYSGDSYYCEECGMLCEMYEQGLSCRCDNPWETEVLDPCDYPSKWIEVRVEARRI